MMEAVIAEIAPNARLIHYAHGIDDYDITSAARVLETVSFVAAAIHVCVCDPSVGTARRPLALRTQRGEILSGPDNGVLLPAAAALGGIQEAREITNQGLMRVPISRVFHGRDVFSPTAAHLVNGFRFEDVGRQIEPRSLEPPPHTDAQRTQGQWLARVIFVDKFGNAHLNIDLRDWQSLAPASGSSVDVVLAGDRRITVDHVDTFGHAPLGAPIIVSDNDGRPSLAVNRGSFASSYGVSVEDEVAVAIHRS
jgi:S-adenosylmethionine hydrolase